MKIRILILIMIAAATAAGAEKHAPPQLMLWSWSAEDDFRPLLAGRDIGVAYLGLSLSFEGQNDVSAVPRRVPVRIAPETYQMLVVRFDYRQDARPAVAFSQKQRQLAVKMVAEMAALARPKALQIDFDAPLSARPFYRQVLNDVRERIGPDVFFSITALVSWCDSTQSWLTGLPVDEFVPMAFRMGQASSPVVTRLTGGGQFPFKGCRSSLGAEMYRGQFAEEALRPHAGQRAYIFLDFDKWSAAYVTAAVKGFVP